MDAVLSKQFERSRLQSKLLLSNCFGLGFSTSLQGARLECRIATATSAHDTSDIGVKPIPVKKKKQSTLELWQVCSRMQSCQSNLREADLLKSASLKLLRSGFSTTLQGAMLKSYMVLANNSENSIKVRAWVHKQRSANCIGIVKLNEHLLIWINW